MNPRSLASDLVVICCFALSAIAPHACCGVQLCPAAASAAATPATGNTAAAGMRAKGATLRALWLTAAVATAISGPRSSASASTAASSSAFVGAAAATVAPLEPFREYTPLSKALCVLSSITVVRLRVLCPSWSL